MQHQNHHKIMIIIIRMTQFENIFISELGHSSITLFVSEPLERKIHNVNSNLERRKGGMDTSHDFLSNVLYNTG